MRRYSLARASVADKVGMFDLNAFLIKVRQSVRSVKIDFRRNRIEPLYQVLGGEG